MTTYNISADQQGQDVVLKLAFGEPAGNDQIVVDAAAALKALDLQGGRTVFLNGPASLPVAVAIAHGVVHLYSEVAVYDPKLAAYVIAVSHGGRPVGSIVTP